MPGERNEDVPPACSLGGGGYQRAWLAGAPPPKKGTHPEKFGGRSVKGGRVPGSQGLSRGRFHHSLLVAAPQEQTTVPWM